MYELSTGEWDNRGVSEESAEPLSLSQRIAQLPPSVVSLISKLGYGPVPAQILHVRSTPAREAITAHWPEWVHPDVQDAFESLGVPEPYLHQVQAADLAHTSMATGSRQHLILATGTASGKSLAYLLPSLDAVHRGEIAPKKGMDDERATVLYLSPTKALAADQLNSIRALELSTVRAETYDGDTPASERRWIRQHANVILCNPDMLHYGILPNHAQWSSFVRRLKYVVLDEAHSYRGVFGAHIAVLLRRLRRICRYHGASPVFFGASATSAEPEQSFAKLLGVDSSAVTAITEDTAPHGATHTILWEPEFREQVTDKLSAPRETGQSEAEKNAPQRKSVIEQSAEMLTDLVVERTRTIAFIKSRRGAEAIAQTASRYLDEVEAGLSHRVAAYRSGFLPEERRELERQLRSGEMLGIASTSALELGIDIAGLDAVLVAGWPGTRASFFQQIGRAGRAGQESLSVLIASADPLDTYLVHHPEDIFTVVESTVFDPTNPYVLSPHLCAAAAELPLRTEEVALFGPTAGQLLERLVAQGYLRRRATGWFWTHPENASELVDLRGGGGSPLQIIEIETGTVVGTMDASQAQHQGHVGAIYTHQSATYVVEDLDLENRVIAVSRVFPDYFTQSRDLTEVKILSEDKTEQWGPVTLHFGHVRVRTQVVSYQRKSLIGQEVLGEEILDLPPQNLMTTAIWFTMEPTVMSGAGVKEPDFPGTLHAAEHAAIGLLPLIATCDRWDIGGLSTALHMDTEKPTIFVYDGHQGGAGFAERGFAAAQHWIRATLDTIRSCECETGCPSCVQSPKCGNRNDPLEKDGAARLLEAMLMHAMPRDEQSGRISEEHSTLAGPRGSAPLPSQAR